MRGSDIISKHDTSPACISHLQYQLVGGHLRVWRIDGGDKITWDELQAVKNEAIEPESTCIEVYPPESELVNDVNLRHLWVVPDGTFIPNLQRRTQWRDA
jgi:hypothetical protein